MKTDKNKLTSSTLNLNSRIILAMILSLAALLLPLLLTAYADELWGFTPLQRRVLESSLVACAVAIGVWQLRKRLDRGRPVSIGIGSFQQAVLKFLLGFGLLIVPLIISLLLTVMFGWSQITLNWQGAQIDMILLGMFLVFLTDAFPEELIFRGYIFSNLLEKFVKWKSALISLVLFVLFPVILLPIKGLLGPDITTGIVDSISFGYIVYMIFFGAFAIYLRVLTKSIWTGVGFHLMFVYINQIMGLDPTNLIQFSEFKNEGLMQIAFVTMLILTFVGLLAYPKIKGIKLNWFSKNTGY